MSDGSDGPDWAVGCSVVLRTGGNEELSGVVFGYDAATDTLILREQGTHGGVCNVRLLKASLVQEVLSAVAPPAPFDPLLPHIDKQRALAREDKALRAAEAQLARVGEGVTKEAQHIFDALSKTMPCAWSDKSILVMDSVLIQPPYSTEACALASDHGNSGALDRVRKVLSAERGRLGLA